MLNANPLPATEDRRTEARCHCGQLVAKLRRDGVELKCKRCKRIVLIPFDHALTKGGGPANPSDHAIFESAEDRQSPKADH